MLTLIRLFIFFIFYATALIVVFLLIDWLLGHRLLIPLAKALRFKIDDVERTSKKIDKILGGSVDKRRKKK